MNLKWLQNDFNDLSERCFYSIVLGLPQEMPVGLIRDFFEAMACDFLLPYCFVITEDRRHLRNGVEVDQRKVFLIVKFAEESKRTLFNMFYHNQPMPSTR